MAGRQRHRFVLVERLGGGRDDPELQGRRVLFAHHAQPRPSPGLSRRGGRKGDFRQAERVLAVKDGVDRLDETRHGTIVFTQREARLVSHARTGAQIGEDVRAAKAVDGLLRVAHDHHRALPAAVDALKDVRLGAVRVLILIDEREPVALPDPGREGWHPIERFAHREQEIVVAEQAFLTDAAAETRAGFLQRGATGSRQPLAIGCEQCGAGLVQRSQVAPEPIGGLGHGLRQRGERGLRVKRHRQGVFERRQHTLQARHLGRRHSA